MSSDTEKLQREAIKRDRPKLHDADAAVARRLKLNPVIESYVEKKVEKTEEINGEFERVIKTERTPAKVDLVKNRAEVQKEIDLMNKAIFSDDVFDKEAALRAWVRSITRNRAMNISDAEKIISLSKNTEPGGVFKYENTYFTVTKFNVLDRLDRYIETLELTVVASSVDVEKFTNLGFYDLIKLAFTRLFKRRK